MFGRTAGLEKQPPTTMSQTSPVGAISLPDLSQVDVKSPLTLPPPLLPRLNYSSSNFALSFSPTQACNPPKVVSQRPIYQSKGCLEHKCEPHKTPKKVEHSIPLFLSETSRVF